MALQLSQSMMNTSSSETADMSSASAAAAASDASPMMSEDNTLQQAIQMSLRQQEETKEEEKPKIDGKQSDLKYQVELVKIVAFLLEVRATVSQRITKETPSTAGSSRSPLKSPPSSSVRGTGGFPSDASGGSLTTPASAVAGTKPRVRAEY